MVVKFVRDETAEAAEDASTLNELPAPPRQVLDRHGARVLDPATAVVVAGQPVPRTTVYRPGTFLLPARYLRDQETLAAINRVLARIGIYAAPADRGDSGKERVRQSDDLPVRALLHVRDDSEPVVVDCWKALQLLRSAASGEKPEIDPDVVAEMSVEHLLFTSPVFGGVPWETSGLGGTLWETSGFGAGSSYGRTRGANRIPVTLAAEPPFRSKKPAHRRPVIAVLDTGIGPHRWFGLADRTAPPPAGTGLTVAPDIQDAILQAELASSTVPTQLLTDYWDAPSTGQPLIGDVDTDTGHGLFIAGIIRQACPEADTLAIRVVHSDGVAYEADVLLALHLLADRVRNAQANNRPQDLVDIVSLSLGYYLEDPVDVAFTGKFAAVIAELLGLGVLVVAAAGNDATTRRFYPAAFADQPLGSGCGPQVISVGALNPDLGASRALFSNEGPWVRCWATGAGVVSTFPADVRGTAAADHEVPERGRSSFDPDDYSAGFAVWDGTSFAAPLAAAELAKALLQAGDLHTVDRDTVVKRAWAALGSL
ncbi:S8 family serine peptidase [Amycolatopsis sp. OK19-0408]|uniref:S8 family serine peptidase n=1 Tax=Amycolatopsis iheyensis TaxID=2945988 RepID=A0A9X2SGA7_9PSEU|nr:S8 family serine peptidase [Amycolatopsis iheyensis]MCR6481552.1 S8 family serine peptidase [Amycolatopsis iheyensis]